MRETYEKDLQKLEEAFSKLSPKELDEIEYLADENEYDRMPVGGVEFFNVDIIRVINAVRTKTEL